MNQTYREFAVGGVLVSPFVAYAGVALLAFLVVRLALARIGLAWLSEAPPIAFLALYVAILTAVILLV